MAKQYHRFVIVGAGISGLQAASILAEHQQDFVILEADNRVGGRICTTTIGTALLQDKVEAPYAWLNEEIRSLPIECGATWISEEQPVMLQMVQDFKLTLFPQNYSGKNVLGLSPKEYLYLSDLGQYYNKHRPKIMKLLSSLKNIELRINQLFELRTSNKITAQLNHELDQLIDKYDSITAEDFIKQQVQDQFLAKLLANEAATLQCAKANQYSVLTLLADEAGPLHNVRFYLGQQKANIDGFRMKEGMSSLIVSIKKKIQAIFDKQGKGKKIDSLIKLCTPVTEIRNNLKPVEVLTGNGNVYSCETVLVGLPIATLGRIKFGSISAGKQLIIDNQLKNVMARQTMIFKRPFWRPDYSGYVSFSHEFPMNELVDLTPSNQQCGVLGFVFTADGLEKWQQEIAKQCSGLSGEQLRIKAYEVNKAKSMRIVADLYLQGNVNHELLQEVAIFTRCLADNPHIRSTYQASTAINTYRRVNTLKEDYNKARGSDEKNVVILGSDFSEEFGGYMQGAVRIANLKVKELLTPKPSL